MKSTCSWGRGRSPALVGVWTKSVCSRWSRGAKSGSRRSPGGVFLQLKSKAGSGSRRSPDGAYRQLKLVTEPSSRRSPDGVLLGVEVMGGARLP